MDSPESPKATVTPISSVGVTPELIINELNGFKEQIAEMLVIAPLKSGAIAILRTNMNSATTIYLLEFTKSGILNSIHADCVTKLER